MTHLTHTCPHCNSDARTQSSVSNIVYCDNCHKTYTQESLNTRANTFFIPPSPLKIGTTVKIYNSSLHVMGKVRMQNNRDMWDEWYLTTTDNNFWIEESYGLTHFLTQVEPSSAVNTFSNTPVGQIIELDDNSVYITERGTATVINFEGTFDQESNPNSGYTYIQGYAEDTIYMIEYHSNITKIFKGYQLPPNWFTLTND